MTGVVSASGVVATDFSGVYTDSSASPGPATINSLKGKFSIAAAGTNVTITNNQVNTNSIIMVQVVTNDATAKSDSVVAGAGSFVVTLNAAATGTVVMTFLVFN